MEIVHGNRGLCAQPCRLPYELYEEGEKKPLNRGYLLSPRDLNGTAFLPDLIRCGVTSLKIEGRLKNPEYVAEVTRYYRKYIDLVYDNISLENDEIKKLIKTEILKVNESTGMNDKEEITQVFNRGGFSSGHLSNAENTNLVFKQKSNNMGIFAGKIQKINTNKGYLTIELKHHVSIGDRIGIGSKTYTISELMQNGNNIKKATNGMIVEIGRMRGELSIGDNVYKIESKPLSTFLSQTFTQEKEFKKIPIKAKINIEENKFISLDVEGYKNTIYENTSFRVTSTEKPEKAINNPISSQRIKDQISKTGNTEFEFKEIIVNLGEDLFIPKISILNDLRRQALEGLEQMAIRKMTRTINSTIVKPKDVLKTAPSPTLSLLLNTISLEYNYNNLENIDKLYIPLKFFIQKQYENIIKSLCKNYNTYIYMPSIIRDNKNFNISEIIKNFKIKGAVISNIAQIKLFPKLELIGNYTLNTFNSFSQDELNELGLNTYTISPELNKSEVLNLIDSSMLPSELIVYGKLPLMTNNYCYLSSTNKCYKDCTKLCQKNTKYYLKDRLGYEFRIVTDSIYNLTTIYNSKTTSIKYNKFKVNSIRIDILDEKPEDIQNIVNTIKNGERFEGDEYTNGKIK